MVDTCDEKIAAWYVRLFVQNIKQQVFCWWVVQNHPTNYFERVEVIELFLLVMEGGVGPVEFAGSVHPCGLSPSCSALSWHHPFSILSVWQLSYIIRQQYFLPLVDIVLLSIESYCVKC